MALELHTWLIEGVSPLVQSSPNAMGSGGDDSLTAKKKKYDDNEEAEIRCYRNADKQFVHPTAAFRSAILVAAGGRKINKMAARTVIAGSVFPSEIEVLILDDKQKPIKAYQLHKCRAVVGKAGVKRVRPMFTPWSMKLVLEIDTDFMTTNIITEILNIAGRIVGIGEFRPDTSKGKTGVGTFGRFKAKLLN